MSIHGACFDEGQSGNCGWDCSAFLDGECEIADEFADQGEYINEERLELLSDIYGIVPDTIVQPPDPFNDDSVEKCFFFDEFSIDT